MAEIISACLWSVRCTSGTENEISCSISSRVVRVHCCKSCGDFREDCREQGVDRISLKIIEHIYFQRKCRARLQSSLSNVTSGTEQTLLDDTLHQLHEQWNAADSSLSVLSLMWALVPPSARPLEESSPAWLTQTTSKWALSGNAVICSRWDQS